MRATILALTLALALAACGGMSGPDPRPGTNPTECGPSPSGEWVCRF